ncbi:hypothetical protein DEJ28_08340 [Curtobacterium sp. MCPF17_002]|uniref:hypothetical protein n=1 Tax=Curtobacterium sp. MCPF17_002 TaxID=2175645 RepID=UPI000DA93B40|nr:hypothetical protein [Curtobacterium sp. MCPF17_002]WIB79095.1 hypothetical protein DEJ28_08340 [Curtobacterium sp. MCPF17_002]
MQMETERIRWCAADDERSLLAWTADRASAAGRHLAPIAAVGRHPDGRLVVEVLRPSGTPLAVALDAMGTPTTGVAVTLTVPLLELAAAERSGAVRIGTAGLDDVLVDDAGAVLLCDRPPGATAAPPNGTTAALPNGTAAALPNGTAAAPPNRTSAALPNGTAAALPNGTAAALHNGAAATTPTGHRRSDQDGSRVLLLAARVVWERTDERDPARPEVDAALAEAIDGDVEAVRTALSCIRAAAAPRPVRWEPLPLDLLYGDPAPAASGTHTLLDTVQDVVEHGVPLGGGRRLPLRRALVGAVVATGCAAAAVLALQ